MALTANTWLRNYNIFINFPSFFAQHSCKINYYKQNKMITTQFLLAKTLKVFHFILLLKEMDFDIERGLLGR